MYEIPETQNEQDNPEPSVAQTLSREARIRMLIEDPDCRKGAIAGLRTLLNAGITAADFIPVAGEGLSWGADVLKTIRRIGRKIGIDIKFLDFTPDVGLFAALGSEAFELVSFGIAPTHAVESTLQLKKDIPRIKKAWGKAISIWRTSTTLEARDYEANRNEINDAMKQFDVEPPQR